MKIVIAPDSFKESMTAQEVCNFIENGMKKILKDVNFVKVPMADGGEGTTQSLVDTTNGKIYFVEVTGPLGEKVTAKLGVLGDGNTAIIEMASASGLELVPRDKRNPMITTTYGTGELIKKALDLNVKTILIGIGGSATNDCGAGMIQALGGKILDEFGNNIGFGGGELGKVKTIDLSNIDSRIYDTEFIVACDVQNPLTGPNGASFIFGRQKGATTEMIKVLDNNLKIFANVIKKDMGIDVNNVPGSGAAGGLGAALMSFLSAKLQKGIDIVIKYSNLEEKLKDADLVITGEGRIDGQTRFGKTPYGVVQVAKKYDIPTVAIAGSIGEDIDTLYDYGFDTIFCILSKVDTLENALKNGGENIEKTVENIARFLRVANLSFSKNKCFK